MRLRQVLVYLIRHAIRRTDKGGITLGAYRSDRSDESRVEFIIRGTNSTLSEDDRRQLSEPFSAASSTRRYGDCALQLYLTRRLVELMGGTLSGGAHKSELFCISVPLAAVRQLIGIA